LNREAWGRVTGDFELDHFQPQSLKPALKLNYANLVYACRCCNLVKGSREVDDPFELLRSNRVTVNVENGVLKARNREDIAVRRLIRQLDLNSPKMVQWRRTWMEIVELAGNQNRELYFRLVGFPEDLPNLSILKPPRNDRTAGIVESRFAQHQRGDLPREY